MFVRTHRRLVPLAALAALIASALLAPAASAGTYTSYLGAKPDGTQVPAGPWGGNGISYGTNAGGAFGVAMPDGSPLGYSRTASLSPPSGLTFTSAWTYRLLWAPVGGAVYQPQVNTTWENRGYRGSGGYGGDSASGPLTVANPGSLSINVQCVNFGGSDPAPRCPAAQWYSNRMELGLQDSINPNATLTDAGGELLDGTWQTSATSRLDVTASDNAAGVYRAFVRIGSSTYYASVDPSNLLCQDAVAGNGNAYEFAASTTSLVPCKAASEDYSPAFNLVAIGDGSHTATIGVEDASGNERVIGGPVTLRINAPGGTLPDPGSTGPGGCTIGDDGQCTITNTVAPTLNGTARQGGTLTTDNGSWVAAPGATYTYAWERCPASGPLTSCSPIAGESAASYTLKAADVGERVRARVTATVDSDSASAYSATSAVIAAGPVNQTSPTLSGTAQEDQTLSATQGTWTGAGGATFAYSWLRCPEFGTINDCTPIAGASGSTYILKAADVGNRVRAVVTANLGGALGTGTSSPSGVVSAKPSGGSGGSGGGSGGSGGGGGADKKEAPKPEPMPEEGGGRQGPLPGGLPEIIVPNGEHASRDAKVTVRFVANGRAQVRSKFGRSNAIEGTLKTIKGAPITNAAVQIHASNSVPGAKIRKLGQVKTDERGRFLFMVPAGPSRTITVSYTAFSNDPDAADTARVATTVKAAAKLASPARVAVGEGLEFRGRLRNIRQEGVELQVQALDGKTWRTFDTTTTNKGGRFAYEYRFGEAAAGRIFYFRVVVKSPVYPFAPGASNHRKVKVTR